jgi:alkyl hydroperoxide reductase subunit D
MESHEKIVLQHGVSKEAVQAAVRIASVVHATAVTLDGEDAIAA